MSKSITIDATHYGSDQPTGVELYVQNLLPELSLQLLKSGATVSWVGHDVHAPAGMPEGVSWISSPHIRGWSQVGILKTLKLLRSDVFFTPSGIVPLLYKGKSVMTVHDMASYLDPGSFTKGQLFRLRFLAHRAASRAAKILVPSTYTGQQMQHLWRFDPAKVVLTPLSYIPMLVGVDPIEAIPKNGRAIVFVGRIERKKNLLPLIKGFAKVSHEDTLLILAGKDGYGADEVTACIAGLEEGVKSRVYRLGYISEGHKRWLYERADIVVCPCPTEGFGLPALEAFAEEVPVLAAQAGSLPEVCANAAAYVQADIAIDWKLQLDDLLSDTKKARHLAKAGAERLKSFSWKRTAELTAEALLSV